MRNLLYISTASAVIALVYSTSAVALPVTAVSVVTAGEAGMLSLVSMGVAGAIWLARRKR